MTPIRQTCRTVAYLRYLLHRFDQDRCLTAAGSLAFTTLLALVPLFTVALTLTAELPYTRELILRAKAFVLANFVPEVSARVVGEYVAQFAQNAARLTRIGVAMLAVTAIALLFTIQSTFDDIWRAHHRRRLARRIIESMAVLVIAPLILGTLLWTAAQATAASSSVGSGAAQWLDASIRACLPLLLTFLVLAASYRFLPSRTVPTRHALFGAAVAMLAFSAMKALFVFYIMRVPTYDLVYGAFASLPIFLAWLFLCWLIVLLGAELAATASYWHHAHTAIDDERAILGDSGNGTGSPGSQLLRILSATDRALSLQELRNAAPMPLDRAEDALANLHHAGMIRIVPGRPLRYARIESTAA